MYVHNLISSVFLACIYAHLCVLAYQLKSFITKVAISHRTDYI